MKTNSHEFIFRIESNTLRKIATEAKNHTKNNSQERNINNEEIKKIDNEIQGTRTINSANNVSSSSNIDKSKKKKATVMTILFILVIIITIVLLVVVWGNRIIMGIICFGFSFVMICLWFVSIVWEI